MELDDDEIPRFSWVINCCWSASWVVRSNILHSWRWRQQNLPLHVLDSAMHRRDERTEVKMFSFFFCLLFMVMGELASPESVCVAQCTLFILRCPMFARVPPLMSCWCLMFARDVPCILPLPWVDGNDGGGLAMQAILTYRQQQRCMLDRCTCGKVLSSNKDNGAIAVAIEKCPVPLAWRAHHICIPVLTENLYNPQARVIRSWMC